MDKNMWICALIVQTIMKTKMIKMVALPNNERIYPDELEMDEELQNIDRLLIEAETEANEAVEEIISELEEVEDTTYETIYIIVGSCLNCRGRKYRLGRKVYCSQDERLTSERIVCSRWLLTDNKRILTHQERLLPVCD